MDFLTVQTIASLSLETIPSTFMVRNDEQSPPITALHGEFLEVPVIDLGLGDDSDVVRKISDASSEWGMFQIVNHGIPDDVISKMQIAGKEFFELVPPEEKRLVANVPGSGSVEGYGSKFEMETEEARSWVDHLFLIISPPSAINSQFWPKNPPSFRNAYEDYANKLRVVFNKLFECLSMGLGLKPHLMKQAVGGFESLIYLSKTNYYPPCSQPDHVLGVMSHTDMSTMTILVPNEVPGLQVLKNDRWYDVKYIPNALIVHIGDQIEILSNGKYKAVYHRSTVSKDKTRMSWPVFLEPAPEQEIGPIPELVNEENPAKYKTKMYKDFKYCKLSRLPQ